MKKRQFFLSMMTAVALVARGYLGTQTFSHSENEYSSLLLQNIEALSLPEDDLNYMEGYELTACYDTKEIGGKEIRYQSGEICQPTNPGKTCMRKSQWGNCY